MAVGPQLRAILERYGLGSLVGWASEMLINGASEAEIELELFNRPEFQRAYPEIEMRRKLAEQTGVHVEPISPDQILGYRTQARAMMRAYGLPPSFYQQDSDFQALIVNDVSIDELNTRLDTAVTRVWQAPVEVRAMFGELTGITERGRAAEEALFAIFVDSKKALPHLENLVQEAEAGGAARRFGFNLTRTQMGRIADININYGQAVEGFSTLDLRKGLFDEALFEQEDLTAEEEGIEAVFGLEAGAEEKLRSRAESRVAQTKGGAGGAVEERGAVGLGGAGRR